MIQFQKYVIRRTYQLWILKIFQFVTDNGVSKCGSLKLTRNEGVHLSKELLVQMGFCGQGEVVATALDLANGNRVDAQITETDC